MSSNCIQIRDLPSLPQEVINSDMHKKLFETSQYGHYPNGIRIASFKPIK
jgi:hypothetical protein